MEGSKFLQILTLLICAGLLYFAYDTNKKITELHDENVVLWNKMDSLQISTIKNTAKTVAGTQSKAASLLDEMFTDLEKEYRASKKASSSSSPKVTVKSTYRLEDRYVSGGIYTPEFLGNSSGSVIVNVSVDYSGDVKKTSINAGTTITDEEVLEACRKAALKTHFNYDSDRHDMQQGSITFTITKK